MVAGSLTVSITDPNSYLAGASGGVYSLILAHLSTLILNWKEDVLIVRPKVWKKRGQEDKTAKATHGTLIRQDFDALHVLVQRYKDFHDSFSGS